MTIDGAKKFVMQHCGSAFVKGVSIDLKKGSAKVIVKSEGGVEKEIIISLPSGDTGYK